jgi:hypothetical protein
MEFARTHIHKVDSYTWRGSSSEELAFVLSQAAIKYRELNTWNVVNHTFYAGHQRDDISAIASGHNLVHAQFPFTVGPAVGDASD